MKLVWKIIPYPVKIYESNEIHCMPGIYCIQPEGILFQTAAQVIEEGCRIAGLDYGTSNGTKVKFMPAETAPGGWEDYAQKPEGYVLSISQDMICLFASTPAGFLYGAITFKQILVQFGGEIPCCIIGDAPALPHRGVQLCLAQINVACRREYILDFIRRIAEMKYNAIYLYFEWFFQYPSLPFAGGPGSMSRDDIQIFQEECRKYGIQLIPAVNLLGHSGDLLDLQCFHHLAEYPEAHKDPRTLRGQNNFCIHQPRVCELIDNALNDLMDIFDSEIIHVGGDEVWEIGTCPHCREEVERHGAIALYARHFGRIREKLQERNRRMGIWGDMILMKLEPELFQKVYWKIQPDSFHVAPDVLAPLRGSIIYDWHYGRGSEETLTYFKDRGFDVVASTSTYGCYTSTYWPAGSIYQKTLLGQACQLGLYGGLVTDWINVTGYHIEMVMPAVATGAIFMWAGNSTDYADKDSGKNIDPEMGPGIDADTITEAGTGGEMHNIQALEEAYALQRYHRELPGLIDFWHYMGDAKGPILKHFRKGPNGYPLRKFLYLSYNIMDFWHYMAFELTSHFAEYKEAVSRARVIWEQLEPELAATGDKYVGFLKAPLILHEQLVERFQLCEDLYALYNGAASAQYTCPGDYTRLLKEASERIRQFLPSMEPVICLTREWHEWLGLEKMAEHRVKLAVYKSKHLANYLEHLSNCKNGRPLPTFAFLHDVILDHSRSSISISRVHEWAQEPELFLHHDTMIYNEYGGVKGEIE